MVEGVVAQLVETLFTSGACVGWEGPALPALEGAFILSERREFAVSPAMRISLRVRPLPTIFRARASEAMGDDSTMLAVSHEQPAAMFTARHSFIRQHAALHHRKSRMPLQHVSLYRRPATATFVVTLALLISSVPTLCAAADWAMAGYDLSNDHSQPNETRISAASVSGLQVAWTYQTLGSVSATPLVTGGFVYFPDWGGGLHKLEARSGKLVWSHKVSEYTSQIGRAHV